MCDKAVEDCLGGLKFVPDWFVASKMIKKLFTALYGIENILYFNEYCSNVTFCCNEMGILSVNLNNIYLDNNFGENDPYAIIFLKLLAWHSNFKKCKALK